MGTDTGAVEVRRTADGWALAATGAGTAAGAVETATAGLAGVPLGVVFGVLALVGAFVTLRWPRPGGALFAVAGLGGLLIDVLGAGPLPRILPGAVLLFAAALALGAAWTPGPGSARGRWVVGAGVAAQAVVGGLVASLGLVAPDGVVLALLVVWAGLLGLGLRGRPQRPWLVAAAAGGTLVAAAVVLWVGSALLGWTA